MYTDITIEEQHIQQEEQGVALYARSQTPFRLDH